MGGSFDRVACNYALPINVKSGYYLRMSGFKYEGSTIVSSDGQTQFSAEHFFATGQGPKIEKTFTTSNAFTIKDGSTVNSPCGGSLIFRINSSIISKGTNSDISVDEAFKFDVQAFPC